MSESIRCCSAVPKTEPPGQVERIHFTIHKPVALYFKTTPGRHASYIRVRHTRAYGEHGRPLRYFSTLSLSLCCRMGMKWNCRERDQYLEHRQEILECMYCIVFFSGMRPAHAVSWCLIGYSVERLGERLVYYWWKRMSRGFYWSVVQPCSKVL